MIIAAQGGEIEKSIDFLLNEIIEYTHNSIVIKTIISKDTGNIRVVALDEGKTLIENNFPFDHFILVIEGVAEVTIDEKTNMLHVRHSIIIPAFTQNIVRAVEQVKIISAIIKSGYEE